MSNQLTRYTKQDYLKGQLNLMRHERRLLLTALHKCDWNATKAYKLNYSGNEVVPLGYDGYLKLLKRHHIYLREKTFKKLSELN